jgi:hypothetical protein
MEIWQFGREKARLTRYVITHYVENIYFKQQILGCLENVLFILVSGKFGVEMEWKVVVHIKELGKVGFTTDRTVHAIAYRCAVELNHPHKFDSEELARYD